MIIVICQDCKKYKHVSGEVGDREFQPRCTCPIPPPPQPVHWVETEEEMKRPKFFAIPVEIKDFDTEPFPFVSISLPHNTLNSFFSSCFKMSPNPYCLQPRRSPKSHYWKQCRQKSKRRK